MYIVRKGYTVFWRNFRINEGEEIPPHMLSDVLSGQIWKVEEKNKKKETKQEIKDIVSNKMMKDNEVKKT